MVAGLLLIVALVLAHPGYAAARGEENIPGASGTLYSPADTCKTQSPSQAGGKEEVPQIAADTLCRLADTTRDAARSLFGSGSVFQFLPWAPMLVGVILAGLLALGGWCAWKMKGYRPRRKYKIGRVI